MDSIGDYLYIVILVIAGLSGLLKKKKKPAKVNMPAPEVSDFEEFEQKPKYEEGKEIKSEILEWEKSEAAGKTKPDYVFARTWNMPFAKKETKPVISEIFKKNDFAEVEEDENNFELELDTAGDLKKAIIYSEILNKKY